MKIALIGYGKMGKILENIAQLRGHEVVARIDINNPEEAAKLPKADVAIEFTRPESAYDNVERCIKLGIPIVCGTTGWLARYDDISRLCHEHNGAFFYASNYSIGVNIFFELNRQLAIMMKNYPMYDVNMKEIHHTQKLDAPSGTAITLAEGIIKNLARKSKWVCDTEGGAEDIVIKAERIDTTPGTHIVTYDSAIDSIEITHTAHSREGFATGAVLAAEWILGKHGVFSMKDMLGF
jgi:4-hydroxy-tetrahydrodipicolinate reductase